MIQHCSAQDCETGMHCFSKEVAPLSNLHTAQIAALWTADLDDKQNQKQNPIPVAGWSGECQGSHAARGVR